MKRAVALCAPAFVLAVALAGCGGSSSASRSAAVSSPRISSASLSKTAKCGAGVLPAGFRIDSAHSGRLTAQTYSASADMQAALEYDQLQSGARQVFVHRPSAGTSVVDGVATCVSLTFASADQATRFFGSYRTLRKQASSLVERVSPPSVDHLTDTAAYLEKQQSFRGYGIASTDVLELAGRNGSTLDIVSVAGAPPSSSLARRLLTTIASGA